MEYESLGERLYYYYLELDNDVVRYYVQPVEVPIYANNKVDEHWLHIPDVLVFRNGEHPYLHQVKHEPEENNPKLELINYHCESYAANRDWNYRVIYPKSLPPILLRNVRFLKNFLKERSYYSTWYIKVKTSLSILEETSVYHLAETFRNEIDPLLIKPLVYHLIASGEFLADVSQIIDSTTHIKVNNTMLTLGAGGE
ncbi:hypothetical protein MU1_57800 [Paenibacillus glycanilyticus]|uniref:TnsA endonuclease N-terminal domain-containing protein n=1 Tax=Paenibacillus glycanilyticus TaxID=126569 RepID=A0ABQ6GLP4_9BACL|nr:hypothetical protein MU1_57800 [Paenibacillus glycanilyticus]